MTPRAAGSSRTRCTAAALTLLVVALAAVLLVAGDGWYVPPGDVWRVLTGADAGVASFVVGQDRLPLTVVGLFAGAAFGVSGAVFTATLRNPLASPDVIGVTAGASASAVVTIVVLGADGPSVPVAALLGTGAVTVAVALLAGLRGPRLVLVGIGVAAVLQAVVSFLLTRSDVRTASQALRWLTGSLTDSTWDRALPVALGLAACAPVLALVARHLPALELGDDLAAGLGVPVTRTRAVLLAAGTVLAAVATAAAGPVAFVALVSAPLARRLAGGRTSLPVAALTGAAVVLAAQLVAANAVPDVRLPVGVVTGAVGALVLLALLTRRTA